MQRREFLMGTGMLALSLMTLKARAASSDGPIFCEGDPNQPLEAQISANHGHRLLVPRQDVLAGKDKSYDIQGAASHGHIVIVTEELFAELRKSGTVTIAASVVGGHRHNVTLICAN